MPTSFVFEGLKAHLKARGMTYADVARALKVSEPTIKRIFATRFRQRHESARHPLGVRRLARTGKYAS